MDNFLLIFVCLIAGLLISHLRLVPADSYKSINAWLIYIAMPALSLRYIPEININSSLLILFVSPVVIWLGALVFIKLYSKIFNPDKNTRTALFLTIALGNTGFVGFPLTAAYFGNEAVSIAIIFDQATFLLFSTLAVIVVMRNTGGSPSMKKLLRDVISKLLRFPPFIACVTAFVLPNFFDYSFADNLLEMIASTLSPLALFSIGLQLRIGEWRKEWRNLIAGLGYKLMIAPLLIVITALIFSVKGDYAKIAVLQAAMPSHVTTSLLAAQYNLNPRLCALMVGFSLSLCFLTTFIWYIVSNLLF